MHSASYFPEYYYARDLIPGATGIPRPLLNSYNTRGIGTGYNIPLQQSSVDHFMAYVKEVMRQTMLKHEAIFRYQVHELHRLYRRQKELVNEVQRRYIQLQMSQLDPIRYPMQSDSSQKPLRVPDCPFESGRGRDPSLLGAEKFHGPVVEVRSEQVGTNYSSKIENGQKELNILPSITKKFGKRMLDLELPADQYIDSEEQENNVEENVERPHIRYYPPNVTSRFIFESDLKLSSSRTIGSPSIHSSCGRPSCLIDLNEPIQLDESDIPNSTSHVESATCCMETVYMDQDLSPKSKKESEVSDGVSARSIQVGKDIEACSKTTHLEERQLELLPHYSEAGLNGASLSSFVRVSSTERRNLGSEFSEEDHDLHAEVHTKVIGACISSSHQLVPQAAERKTKALCTISSKRKSIQDLWKTPKAVQALPCFNNPKLLDKSSKSAIESSRNNREILHMKKSKASDPSFGNVSSHPTVTIDNSPTSEECSPSKRLKNSDYMKSSVDMDLNCMPPRWSSEVVAQQDNDGNRDEENGSEDSVKVLGWLRKSCLDGDTLGFPDLTRSNNFDDQFPALDPASCKWNPFEVKDIENNEIVGKIDSTRARDDLAISVDCNKGDLAVGTGIGNFSRCKASIHLNSCRNEDKSSPAFRERELEAPVSPENKECSPPRGESENLQLEIPHQFSKEDLIPVGELDKIAAAAIIAMSSSGVQLCLEAVTNKPSQSLSDCLEWFAGVVSSVAGNLENDVDKLLNGAADNGHMLLISHGNDYFDASKLKLKEIKVEDVCYKSNEQNDEKIADDSLPTRKGRGRRARQQRVFKKKALHTLGGLNRATGAGLGNVTKRKRNSGENGSAKRRPYFNIAHCNRLEQFMYSPLTGVAKDTDIGRCLRGWGLTKGQRKARSARSGFPRLSFFS